VDSEDLTGEEKMTELICGGVYHKEINGRRYEALCTSVVTQTNGSRQGKLELYGYATERVTEGSEELDQYTLIAAPTPQNTKIRRRKAS